MATPAISKWSDVPQEKVQEVIVKNEKGEDVKIITTYREYQVLVMKNKKVDERKKWGKFGETNEANCLSNTSSGEEVFLTLSRNSVSEEEKKDVIQCRNCKRNHFTSKCPYKDALELSQKLNKPEKEDRPDNLGGGNRYVAPSQRVGYQAAAEVPSLIVNNLSSNATEKDLRDLFLRFGYVGKVTIPKLNDGTPRGFAYVTYNELRCAEEAIKGLNGHRYDYLVLSVDFAKKKPMN
ncbi:RNA-binding region RNP-1 domain-containing protein [Cavenderia fasciculata]|uniref:RNA-binding region RNP-1 domain-containing protein n=1 Tax=Cavenderia fasciculata TaxID=261658 RepID=F4PKI9_CACFS|nr:RNA-binding region RNP-1 domain-containing protein [Cavenderia fasciculata]EGG24113.1 RNA-binding region RNP-1 domain-containing protein [Cavenderia fasciculata]|eukprot:XP_004361964.1 RNA-binding region RNP-1 domain-containing protein [Cavenderia fasciculata]